MAELGKFLTSRKFLFVVIVLGAFLALVLTGTLTVSSEQAIDFLKWILGLAIGAHAATDISAVVGQFFGHEQSVSVVEVVDDEEEDLEEDTDDIPTPVETPVPKGVYKDSER